MQITVNGINFRFSVHETSSLLVVYVYEAEEGQVGELIGSATMDHNMEQAFADFPEGGQDLDYFEWSQLPADERGMELARWIAAVAE